MSEPIISKTCRTFKQTKPITEFSKRADSHDGYRNNCKLCRKSYQQSKKGKEYQKRNQRSKKGKDTQSRYFQSDKGKANKKRYATCRPERIKAIYTVNNAIKLGKMPRPDTLLCHYCPKPAQQYHHWHGYEKEHWLDVVPVCTNCHKKIHNKSELITPPER